MQRVPATVVTGFLGAGKTSLVRHLLANAAGRRLAVVVNEFGELGIDRELLLGCGDAECAEDDIVELANGCICCTVAEDFMPGLALPKPLVQAFAWPEIRTRTTVDGVLTVLDAAAVAAGRFADDQAAVARQRAADPALAHDNPLEEVFGDQLACADLVILNKTDLLGADDLAALRGELIGKLRPGVRVVMARNGAVPPEVALGVAAAAEDDLAARPSLHDDAKSHDHDDFESFVVRFAAVGEGDAFPDRLRAAIAAHDVLRIKGFLNVPGRDWRLVVQAVGDRIEKYFDRPWQAGETRTSRLVVIGQKGLDLAAIAAALGADAVTERR
jgi:cobalamin biosynthesis protein CobW